MRNVNYTRTALAALLIISAMVLAGCGSSVSVPDEYAYDNYDEYIKLANYKGIKYDKISNQVSQSEIQEQIDEMLSESAEDSHIDKGEVKADSVVNIDYVGSVDGKEFDGGAAENVDLDIADSGYIDGFAEGIIGHKVGETFDLHVKFPDDYGAEDLAGKDAVFKTTINYLKKKTVPEYNDEWVENNTDYENMSDFEAGLKKEILANKANTSNNQERSQVFEVINSKSKVIKYPDKEYKDRYDQMVDMYKSYAEANNLDFAKYLSEEMGLTEKEFEEMADETVKSKLKQELVMNAIAKAEGINITDADYNDYLAKILKDSGYTEKSYEAEKGYSIQEYAEKNNLYTSLLYQDVMDKVMEYSVAR